MFTGNTIDLKSAGRELGLDVLRDCSLSYIGKVPTQLPRRVVPCGKVAHIEAAILRGSGVSGIIVTPDLADEVPARMGLAVSNNPVHAAYALHEYLCGIDGFLWKHFDTRIHPSAHVHTGAHVAERDVEIGPNCEIYPGAVVLPRTVMQSGCAIGPGTVVGTNAFEVNAQVLPRRILKQAGGVFLEDNVEVQAKCTLVRSTFGGFTHVGAESKFDCQIHLAHDCRVGKRVQFAACAEISGRVTIGDDVFLGPNCSISNGVTIGDGAHITIGAVVVRDVAPYQRVSGNFAVDHDRLITHIKAIR